MEKNVLGNKIHQLRKTNNMSQQNLADKLCVSNKTISKWECGNGSPDIETLNKIANIFHISVDELINENNSNSNENENENIISNHNTAISNAEETISNINVSISHKNMKNKKTLTIMTLSSSIFIIVLIGIFCYLFIPRTPEIVKTNLFSIDKSNSSLYCMVDNEKQFLELSKEIEVSKNCKWGIYTDLSGTNEIASKTVSLDLGDNKFYIIIENSNDEKKIYETTIRRKYVYTITFDSSGGNIIASQSISEGGYCTPKTPIKDGYIFLGWYYNGELFSFNETSIKSDMNFTAKWEPISLYI